jgi:hypothetical protein
MEDNMKRFLAISMLILCVTASYSTPVYAQPMSSTMSTKMVLSKSSVELKMKMRKLWEDHVTYTRNYIISSMAELGDTTAVVDRLFKNQDEIGAAIKPFYGEAAGKKLATMLREHITLTSEIVKEAKMGNNVAASEVNKKWYANADDIAIYLSAANPNWNKVDVMNMLFQHLDFTTQEVVARQKKDWAANIDAYDRGHLHMLMFADVLTVGIVKQFPKRFAK